MIEQNIIELLELGDTIQKLDLFNKRNVSFYKMNYLLSLYSHFPEIFYFFLVLIFFLQIIELNIAKMEIGEDGILNIIKYTENIFLFHKFIKDDISYIIILIITMIIFLASIIISYISMIIYNKKK